MHKVTFYDWFHDARDQLGRLGITIGEVYEMERHELSSMVMNLYEAELAVMIQWRPLDMNKKKAQWLKDPGRTIVWVSNYRGSRPFGQIG